MNDKLKVGQTLDNMGNRQYAHGHVGIFRPQKCSCHVNEQSKYIQCFLKSQTSGPQHQLDFLSLCNLLMLCW